MTLTSEDTEDTDPITRDGDDKVSKEERPITRSLWLRILGGVLLSVAVGFIIYGLTMSAGTSTVADKEVAAKPIVARPLKNIPADETRSFQYFQLPNGLKVVNVQDDRALQMAFAVAVQAGSFSDPVALPGLAHFCEHMLFLGTKKYPETSGFDNFIAAHGGINNAYTSDEVTVYFASLSQDAGADGLDHFADFFRAPLFKHDYVEKEVLAINSEHEMNVKNPQMQVLEVMYSLANPDSPISRFHTGNVNTLMEKPKGMKPPIDPEAALMEFWKEHYCPNHMTLVTVSSDKLAAQMDLVKQEFGELQPHSAGCQEPVRKYDAPPAWPDARLRKWINVQSAIPKATLWLMFPLPDVSKDYQSQPLDYIDYMLTYGGEGSLARVLKDSIGLVSSFETMYDTSSAGTHVMLVMRLTKLGRENIALTLDVLFAYLARLRRSGVDEALYDSLAQIEKLKWDWDEPDSPAGTADALADRMTRVDDATKLLSADTLIEQTNPGLVRALVERIKPSNMNVAYVNPRCDKSGQNCSGISEREFFEGQSVLLLPHYNVSYSVRAYDDVLPDTVQRWENWLNGSVKEDEIKEHIKQQVAAADIKTVPGSNLTATPPGPITRIPKEIPLRSMHASFGDMAHFEEHGGIDALLFGQWPVPVDIGELPSKDPSSPRIDKAEVWYRGGWVTTSAKVQFKMQLRPLRKKDEKELEPMSDVLLELYGRLLGEEMAPKLVDLTVTGVSYEIDVGANGLGFSFLGFQPNMPELISEVLSEFNRFNKDPAVTPDIRFQHMVHRLEEDLTTYSDLPLNYARADRNLLLMKGPKSRQELLQELQHFNDGGVTAQKAAQSVSDLLLKRKLRLTALAMGNLDSKKAQDTVTDFLQKIKVPNGLEIAADADSGGEVERVTPIVNIGQPIEVRKLNPRKGDPNDVVVVSFIVGLSTVESRVHLGLISQMLKPVAYDDLRTNRDLGYMVNSVEVLLSNVQLISTVVQGEALNADLMEAAVQRVLTDLMPKHLKDLSDKEFQQYKTSYREELIQPPTTASEEFEHFSGPVGQGGKCFDLQNEMLRYLDGPLATKETLIKEYDERITPSAGERQKIVIKYFAGDVLPKQPTLKEAKASWVNESIPANMIDLLEREYNNTKVLYKVDSQERAELVKSGHGWFPTEQNCKLQEPEKSAVKGVPEVPEQVRQLVQRKTQDVLGRRYTESYVPKVSSSSPSAATQSPLSPQEPKSSIELMARFMQPMHGKKHHHSSLRP